MSASFSPRLTGGVLNFENLKHNYFQGDGQRSPEFMHPWGNSNWRICRIWWRQHSLQLWAYLRTYGSASLCCCLCGHAPPSHASWPVSPTMSIHALCAGTKLADTNEDGNHAFMFEKQWSWHSHRHQKVAIKISVQTIRHFFALNLFTFHDKELNWIFWSPIDCILLLDTLYERCSRFRLPFHNLTKLMSHEFSTKNS